MPEEPKQTMMDKLERELKTHIDMINELNLRGQTKTIVEQTTKRLEIFIVSLKQVIGNMISNESILDDEFSSRGDIYSIVPAFPEMQHYIRYTKQYMNLKQQEIEIWAGAVKELCNINAKLELELVKKREDEKKPKEKTMEELEEEAYQTTKKDKNWRRTFHNENKGIPAKIRKMIVKKTERRLEAEEGKK